MGIMKTIEKALFKLIVIMIGFITVAFIVMTICCGPFGSEVDNTAQATTPIVTSTQIESSIDPHIIVYKDSQNDIVECERLSVFGNNNVIHVMNKDVEKILITGHGNVITYSRNADPEIIDHGNYNDVYQTLLT